MKQLTLKENHICKLSDQQNFPESFTVFSEKIFSLHFRKLFSSTRVLEIYFNVFILICTVKQVSKFFMH